MFSLRALRTKFCIWSWVIQGSYFGSLRMVWVGYWEVFLKLLDWPWWMTLGWLLEWIHLKHTLSMKIEGFKFWVEVSEELLMILRIGFILDQGFWGGLLIQKCLCYFFLFWGLFVVGSQHTPHFHLEMGTPSFHFWVMCLCAFPKQCLGECAP